MPQRFYPAVLERGEHGAVGVWFPDFPGCVVGGQSQEEAMARASDALEEAMRSCAELEQPLPVPTPMEQIRPPAECDVICLAAIGASPPNPSDRVNVYLPRNLIDRIDRLTAELGMNRSSFFGMAANELLARYSTQFGTFGPARPFIRFGR
ncbi:MAG TPA: type II toxin-antitoxin system HicB family antitoxin [Caulobacteraceae bacterium]|jgi:predicted RNase H-like HicB family nuclease|nr:type II toxin-antitoxin system HicB family antitoxin [Caulobacteraceae bacterium]